MAYPDLSSAEGLFVNPSLCFLVSAVQSTVCQKIMEQLGQTDMDQAKRQVVSISMDSFYRPLTGEEKLKADRGQYNFDHPDAIDEELMYRTLTDILAGKKVEISSYDFCTNSLSEDKRITIFPADVILFEGILTFYFPQVRDLFHMKLFVDTDSDTRLARRVPRDVNEYHRDLDQVLNYYLNYVKPAFEEFCSPVSEKRQNMKLFYYVWHALIKWMYSLYRCRPKSLPTSLFPEEQITQVCYVASCPLPSRCLLSTMSHKNKNKKTENRVSCARDKK